MPRPALLHQLISPDPYVDLNGNVWDSNRGAWRDPRSGWIWGSAGWQHATPRDATALASPRPAPRAIEQPPGSSFDVLIASYDWPVQEALAVMYCESKGDPSAVSSAGAVGLFQIHPYDPANLDPATNVAAAYGKYRDGLGRGDPWFHWSRFGGCGRF